MMELADSLNLTDYVLLTQKLEEPIVTFLLHHFNLANVFHVGVDTDP